MGINHNRGGEDTTRLSGEYLLVYYTLIQYKWDIATQIDMIFGCVSENSLFSHHSFCFRQMNRFIQLLSWDPDWYPRTWVESIDLIGMSSNLMNHAYFKVYDLCLATCIHTSTYPCMYRYHNMLFICFYTYCFL